MLWLGSLLIKESNHPMMYNNQCLKVRADIFLSVVVVLRDDAPRLLPMLHRLSEQLSNLVNDYELIMVDNMSTDGTMRVLEELTKPGGMPNLQCYVLTKEVDFDTASWAGVSSALGDFVAVVELDLAETSVIADMVARALEGTEVVLARNTASASAVTAYSIARRLFVRGCRRLIGVDFANDAPRSRLLSRGVVNHLQQYNVPTIMYRALPAKSGFTKSTVLFSQPRTAATRSTDLWGAFDRGVQLLVTSTSAPMRLVGMLSLFGAAANLLYSLYVIAVALTRDNVAPGWVTLSLQQSGMFFLLSLVLFVLGEYVLNIPLLHAGTPKWHIAREFASATITRKERLNIQEGSAVPLSPIPTRADHA